ncbi:septum formation protein Maf [Halorhodospira abdelmalekii]|uniref:Maf family protein n=1 Tax=Halorhodospira abdelmalekii TaxID=421629 RepID=UPI001902DF33|nr:Maf family protein [Halorhodospira abdelmalekii]MBK1734624.1 septum formation protein Maf [Halorhodospira abdelmalekii]
MLKSENLILASTSPYRRQLLARLGIEFAVAAPQVDETIGDDERPQEAVLRLAAAKAHAVTADHPGAVIIGGDQIALLGDEILGKPHTREAAIAQLTRASGNHLVFLTGLAVTDGDRTEYALEPVHVHFRRLDSTTIARYVDADTPFDCAGALRSEGLGSTLLEAIESRDPTALIGLPLIAVSRLLRQFGIPLP